MPRASDLTIDLGDMSFLLIGEAGSYKTRFFGTMPFPVYVFDFDKGMASNAGAENIEYDVFKDAPVGSKGKPDHGIYPFGTGWEKFIAKLNTIGEQMDKGTCPYKALGFDSYTMMADLCLNHVLYKDTNFSDKRGNPQIQHWGTFGRLMRNILDQITSWPGIKVITAHVERATNPLTESMEQLPLANGKMQGLLPTFCDEVYYCEVKQIKQGDKVITSPTVVSVKDAVKRSARSRWHVPSGTALSWPAILTALQQNKAKSSPTSAQFAG